MASIKWNKYGEWRPESGPTYIHEIPGVGKLLISGSWGTVGDNLRGWKKTRFYHASFYRDGVRTEIGHGGSKLLSSAKKNAEKFLARLTAPATAS